MSRGSAVDFQADEQAGITRLSWPQSSRRSGRCHAAQLAYIKKMSRQVSRGSAGHSEAKGQAGVVEAQLAYIKQMSRHVSRGSAGHSQADEQAGVPRLSWRLSSR